MNILDIIILICLVPAVIQGIRKGIISQIISTISIFLGIWLACKFAIPIGSWLSGFIDASEQTLNITAFALILILICVGLLLLCKLLERVMELITLGWLNKLLGVVFALIKCILILGVAIFVFEYINTSFNFVSQEYIAQSSLYGVIKDIADTTFPLIKSLLTNSTHE